MASIEETRQQIASGRQELVSAKSQAESITARQVSRTELQKRTLAGKIERAKELQRTQAQKEQTIQQVEKQTQEFEAEVKPVEEQIAQVEAAQREAEMWQRADALIRKGKAYASRGSELYPYVRELLDNQGYGEMTHLTDDGTFYFGGRSVAEVQARKKIAEATIEIGGLKGTDFTPVQAFQAQKEFQSVLRKVESGETIPIKQLEVLKKYNIIQEFKPIKAETVELSESILGKKLKEQGMVFDSPFKVNKEVLGQSTKVETREGNIIDYEKAVVPYKKDIIQDTKNKLKLFWDTKVPTKKEVLTDLSGIRQTAVKSAEEFAEVTISKTIPEGGLLTPKNAKEIIFKEELAGKPAGLPVELGLSVVPLITREKVTKTYGTVVGGIVPWFIPGLRESYAVSTIAGSTLTIQEEVKSPELLLTGKRPEGITESSWRSYKSDIEKYNKQEIETYKQQQKAKTGAWIELGISGLVLGASAYRFLAKPINPYIIKGKDKVINRFLADTTVYEKGAIAKGTIKTYVPPDRLVYQTRFRNILGLGSKIKQIGKSNKFITDYTLISGRTGGIGEYSTSKVGSSQVTYGIFGGGVKKISIEEFARLSKSQQYGLQKLVESRIGRPVSIKLVPKYLNELKLTQGNMFQMDVYKTGKVSSYIPKTKPIIDIGSKRITILNPEKTIRTYGGVSASESGTTLGIGTKSKELIRTKIQSGKISLDIVGLKETKIGVKPIASGRVNILKGVTKYKYSKQGTTFEPTNLGKVNVEKGIYDIAQIGKPQKLVQKLKLTPLQESAIKNTIQIKPLTKIPSRNIKLTSALKETGIIKEGLSSPIMVGGLGAIESKYYGVGRADGQQYIQVGKGIVIGTQIKQLQVINNLDLQRVKIFEGTKIKGVEMTQILPKIETRISSKSLVGEIQDISQSQQQKPIQRQSQIQSTSKSLISESIIGQPIKPTPPPDIFPTILTIPSPKGKVREMAKNLISFEAFTRRKGKDISLGKFRTQTKAEKKLKKSLVSTLGASGFIEKAGKKLKVKELETFSGGEFGESKIDQFRIIQKKERRLSGRPEVFEIQKARKSGMKKMRWLS